MASSFFSPYGGGAGGSIGFSVSYWGSETFKIVILVENHPKKPKNRLDDYHPLGRWGVLISEKIQMLTIYVHIGW